MRSRNLNFEMKFHAKIFENKDIVPHRDRIDFRSFGEEVLHARDEAAAAAYA
jgi:hypothetical protein